MMDEQGRQSTDAARSGPVPHASRAVHRVILPRWAKVLRDLWSHKTRSLLVVLSIAIGVFAIGTIAGTQQILDQQLMASYFGVKPAHGRLSVSGIDDEMIQAVARMPEVAEASGRFSLGARISLGEGRWRDVTLFALPDYDNLAINLIYAEAGAYPPPEGAVLMERNSLPLADAEVGDEIEVELPDGRLRSLPVAGLVHDINLPPARFANHVYGYVDFKTLEGWGYGRQYNELAFTVAEKAQDRDHIQRVAEQISERIEDAGGRVGATRIPEPGEHPVQDILDPLFLILGILGVLSLILSGFLVVNTMAAVLAQQVGQIGVMKAVGARTGQITVLYLGMALIFGLLALLIGIPLGRLGAYALADFAAGFLNFDVARTGMPGRALLIVIAVGLLLPLAASYLPVRLGARVTVREAISTYGLGHGRFGRGPIDRLLIRVQQMAPWVSRPLLLSLRNTFRRKARLVLTMVTLTLGGAIFIAVFSVQLSLYNTLDEARKYENFDVYVQFDRQYRVAQIQQEALQIPGVVAAETWGYGNAVRKRPDGSEGDRIRLRAPHADTAMIEPNVLTGRWLLPDDENAVVLNSSTLDEEPDVSVGDTITLAIDGKDSDWVVVGIVQSFLIPPTAYANYPYYARLAGTTGRANFLRVDIEPDDPASQAQAAGMLEDRFAAAGYQVAFAGTVAEDLEATEFQFNILVTFLLIMALLMAAVGGMGLMGTMSINVLERTREIGVLRAVGASTGAVLQIVLAEGVLIGLISWLQGAVLALPIGKLMSDQIGLAFVDAPLSYGYSLPGLAAWLLVAAAISAGASFLPARNAARLTVREVLSYE